MEMADRVEIHNTQVLVSRHTPRWASLLRPALRGQPHGCSSLGEDKG